MRVKNPAGAIHSLQPNTTEDQIEEMKKKGFIFLDEVVKEKPKAKPKFSFKAKKTDIEDEVLEELNDGTE